MNPMPRRFARQGFTVVGLLIIIAVLAILAAMLLPALAAAKRKAQRINCVNNLKQDGLAFRLWEGDNGDNYPMAVSTNKNGTMEYAGEVFRHFQVMSNELSTPKILVCPADDRTAAASFAKLKNINVSYFVSVDASEAYPQMFLDGDRNLTNDTPLENGLMKLVPGRPLRWTAAIHNQEGNLGLADGSVQQVSNAGLLKAFRNSGDSTNTWRIAFPE